MEANVLDIESETQKLTKYWAVRDTQLLADRDIINLIKPEADKTDKVRWRTNEPKVFYDTAVALLSSYQPRYRLPLTINFSPEEKEKMNKTERFILGIFRQLDRRQIDRGQNYWLRELAYWILSGWYAGFVVVQQGDNGVEFIADLWDPITVYPEWTNNRLTKLVRTYELDKRSAMVMASDFYNRGLKFEFDEPKDEDKPRVINFWLDDRGKIYNSIMLNGKVIKPLKQEENFKHIPIFTGTVGIPEKTSADWQLRIGENVIASARDMFEYENSMTTLMATILAETAYPNIVTYTQSGAPAVKGEDVKKGYGNVIALRVQDKIELLKHAATPAEVNFLMTWVGRQKQKALFSDAVYGGMPQFEISGFALSQFLASLKYKIGPYLTTMQYTISNIASELLSQYREGKFKKVTLSTLNPQSMQKGLFFVEDFDRQDVPKSLYVDVTIPITSAIDKTQQIMYARQALTPPQLISRETIWDEILDIQDSEQEYARIIQDQTLELPVVKQIMVIEQLRERERFYRNQMPPKTVEADALKNYITQLELQLGGQTQGTQGKAGGIPPEVLPPEMIQNPDMIRAATGTPPSGLGRRSQTPEERARTK